MAAKQTPPSTATARHITAEWDAAALYPGSPS